jgi:hypothetical protein
VQEVLTLTMMASGRMSASSSVEMRLCDSGVRGRASIRTVAVRRTSIKGTRASPSFGGADFNRSGLSAEFLRAAIRTFIPKARQRAVMRFPARG